jgi:predicted permease
MFQDLRFALRLLVKERAFSSVAILVLALGIGVNATGFTLVSGVFLRERSLNDAKQVYVLSWRAGAGRRSPLSHPEFEDWRAQSHSFLHLAALTTATMNISDDRALPEQAFGSRITAEAFAVFGQRPLIGRTFTREDEKKGAAPVAIIGHHLWTNRYEQSPDVLGATLRVNGTPATIVGVMPAGIRFPGNAEVWLPWIAPPAQLRRSSRPLLVFGRLKPNVSRGEAQTEADGLAARLIAAYPDDMKDFTGALVESVPERFVGGAARPMFLAMLGAVSFVLLIACANVANLLLARSAYRAREVAMRMALGATRLRIVRQLLVESLVMAVIGGGFGLLLAVGGVRVFDAAVLDQTRPYWIVFAVDYAILAYVASLCMLTAVVAGLAPALHVSRTSTGAVLKEGARNTTGGVRTRWFSGALTVAQLALTIVLLSGASLMVRSFYNLWSADTGFRPERLLAMRLQLPGPKYATGETRRAFYEELESRIGAIPSVDSVAVTTAVPPFNNEERRLEVEGHDDEGRRPRVSIVRIGPRFFEVVDRRLLLGRGLRPSDAISGSEGVLINDRLARQFFADADPIGRRLRFVEPESDRPSPAAPWHTIVGVSPTIRHASPSDTVSDPVVYVPYGSEAPSGAWIMIRLRVPTASMSGDIRRAVQAIDADQPISTIQTLDELLRERRWPYTAFGGAFAIFAIIALLLSSAGLYALIAYAVTQRTQEIGVRRAVGARGSHIAWLLLKPGLMRLVIGLAVGLAGAFALGGVLSRMLVGVTPGDPLTLAGVAAILSAVAVAACVVPVRRALQTDPLIALRHE